MAIAFDTPELFLRAGLERPRPAAVLSNDLVEFDHQTASFGKGGNDF